MFGNDCNAIGIDRGATSVWCGIPTNDDICSDISSPAHGWDNQVRHSRHESIFDRGWLAPAMSVVGGVSKEIGIANREVTDDHFRQ